MIILSEAEILKQCQKLELCRATMVVLSHIAHFSQLRGGVSIGGEQWRFRTVAEISENVMYGPRTITRALKELVDCGFILRKAIWDPRYPGRRVNAYRVLPVVEKLLSEGQVSRTERRRRSSKDDLSEIASIAAPTEQSRPVRNRQDDDFINREHINEQITELITLPPSAKESQFSYLRENSFEEDFIRKEFGVFLSHRDGGASLNSELAATFWKCLENGVYAVTDTTIEPADIVVIQRTLKYLKMFEKSQNQWLGPLDPCAIALWTYKEWHSFGRLISMCIGSYPKSGMMNSYLLEKYAFLVCNDLKVQKASSAMQNNFFTASFK